MENPKKENIELKELNESSLYLQNVSKDDDDNKEDKNKSNIYFIFSINKTIFDKRGINFNLNIDGSQNTHLIRYDEIESKENKTKLVNQLYCISYTPPIGNNHIIKTNLRIQFTKDEKWMKSFQIEIHKKRYFFLYKHSFEDLKKNYSSNFKINTLGIIQKQLDLQQKYTFFLKRLNPEKWENVLLSKSFIWDTFEQVKWMLNGLII